MARMDRLARIVLGIGSPVVVLTCVVGGPVAAVAFVAVTALVPAALIACATWRRGADRRIVWALLGLVVTLEGASLAIVALEGVGAVLGMIALAAVPLLWIPACYAATFRTSNES
jgi:hypothetical protein